MENSGLFLDGYINEKIETIVLPEGWTWENPETIITEDMEEVTVLFSKNGFEKTEKVSINALVKGEETPETPEKPEGSKPETSKPEESKPDKGNNGLVQTGDISSLGATAAMLMASGATILVTRKRKEKNNILKT